MSLDEVYHMSNNDKFVYICILPFQKNLVHTINVNTVS